MTRERLGVLAVVATGIAVFVIDLFLLPGFLLAAAPYAIPILVAAYFLRPRFVAATTVGAMIFQSVSALVEGTPVATWLLLLAAVALIGALATVLAERTLRVQMLAEERAQLLQREQAARREAGAARQRADAILQSITDGFFAFDRQFRYTYVNEQAERMVRRRREELLGRNIWEVFPEAVGGPFYQAYQRAMAERQTVAVEAYYPPLGAWLEAHAYPSPEGLAIYVRDVTQRRQAEEALRESEERYRELAESISDVFFAMDTNLRYTYWNRASEQLTGIAAKDAIGKSLFELFPDTEATRRAERVYRQALRTRQPQRLINEYELGGKHYVFDITAYPSKRGLSVFTRDITESKRIEAERARLLEAEHRAREEAEAAIRLRDQFLSVAAHELRTPLTSLRGYAELTMQRIEQGRLRDPQQIRHALQVIDRQVGRLTTLVNQLLDISRIEAGELQLERRVTDLVPLTRGMVETMQAGTSKHTLTLQAPPSLPALVDPLRLEEVLYNLIDNAIRYSPRGGPVEVELSTPDPATVRIAVRDHGIGVPPEQRERLFTRFFQAARRPAGGLGLALYISRRIVELHGGRIWAEFPEDGGSRFVVTLPRDRAGGGP